MKNRILIILTFALTFIFNNVKAQVVFLHTHFDPPLTLLRPNNLPVLDTLKMDFNRDGVADLGISWSGWPWNADFISLNPNWDWTIHRVGESSPLSSSNSLWLHENGYISDSDEYEWGVRLKRGNDYYYGWAYTDAFSEPNPGMPFNKIYIALHEMVFCTIPNYPLHWGQTSLDWGVGESEETIFTTLHPNPTTGQVTITGQDLKAAQIINTLGQCVATVKGEGDQLTVDISDLPAGVYFVNITDGEGRKCVRKVVKE